MMPRLASEKVINHPFFEEVYSNPYPSLQAPLKPTGTG